MVTASLSKIQKKMDNFFLRKLKKRGGGEKIQKSQGEWNFIFIFSLLAIIITSTPFRKSSL